MRIAALLAGVALITVAAIDTVSTLITTRRRSARWWPAYVFYRRTWKPWRAVGARMAEEHRREAFLSVYGPLSLLGLLVFWVALQVLGWALVWWALRGRLSGVHSMLDASYFAGVGFFTVGFGDIVPVGGLARMLLLVEAFFGLLTVALLIGYLPTLYGAYSRREVGLLLLDDLGGEPMTPVRFIQACIQAEGLDGLAASFAGWERWCAEILDSHVSYPMLMLFRSKQLGQNWLTALAVVTDAAAITLAAVDGVRAGPPQLLYRRAVQTLSALLRQQGVAPRPFAPAGEERFLADYRRLEANGMVLRPFPDAWRDVQALRATYLPQLEALTRTFLVAREFRSQGLPLAEPKRHAN